MDLDELKTVWQERRLTAPPLTKEELMSNVMQRLERLRREVMWRDARESAVAILVAAIFAVAAYFIPTPLARAGALLLVGASLMVVAILFALRQRHGRGETAPDASLAEFCRRELAHVDAQIRWMRRVAWWYIAPFLAGVNMFFWGTIHSTTAGTVYLIVTVALSAGIYWLNQRAVQRELLPLRRDLQQSLADLSANGA
jgi:hypothetical protein